MAGMPAAIVRAIVDDGAVFVDLVEKPGEEQAPIETGVEGALLIFVPGLDRDAAEQSIPSLRAQGFYCLLYTSPSPRDS